MVAVCRHHHGQFSIGISADRQSAAPDWPHRPDAAGFVKAVAGIPVGFAYVITGLTERAKRRLSPRQPKKQMQARTEAKGPDHPDVAPPACATGLWRLNTRSRSLDAQPRRGAGVVERGGLENRCARKCTEGSNPSPSASKSLFLKIIMDLMQRVYREFALRFRQLNPLSGSLRGVFNQKMH